MENDLKEKKVIQFKNIIMVAEDERLSADEKTALIEAVCEYFPADVVDDALGNLAQKSHS